MSQVYPTPEPPHLPAEAPHRRRSLWSVLPWALLAVAGLVLGVQFSRRGAVARTAPAAVSAPAPVLPATPPSAAPLTVTLSSAGSGKHIRVGTPEAISAFAGLPEGESATVAVSYTKNGGAKFRLSLAQGSLSSTTWTPSAAGRYEFTASALDSRKSAAFSRPMTIWVDPPKANVPRLTAQPMPPKVTTAERPVFAQMPATVRAPATVQTPGRREQSAKAAPKRAAPAKTAAVRRVAAAKAASRRAAKAASHGAASRGAPYRVAAAKFTYRPVAETLAGALRRRGFHASVRVGNGSRGKPTYSVETGEYAHPEDAQQQEALLKRDGYPAFHYQIR